MRLSPSEFIKTNRHLKSLTLYWKESAPSAVMTIITDFYFIPLALFLGADVRQIGWMVAIPHMLGSLSQLGAVHLVRRSGARLPLLVFGARAQAAVLFGIALMAVLPLPHPMALLIVLISLFRILGNLTHTISGSIASDFLGPAERGIYFGSRSQITSLASLAGMLLAGIILYIGRQTQLAAGFFLVFLITAVARAWCSKLLGGMEEVPLSPKKDTDFNFFQFLARGRQSNFLKFTFFATALTFSTNIAAPFFSVHMLKNLDFSYLEYMTIHLGAIIAGLFAVPIWGKHADHVGNARVLWLTSWLVPTLPLLWCLSTWFPFLILVELLAGFAWGGFNLCSVNFIYDAVVPEKRVHCLSYFALINGVAIFCGASLGGYLAGHLPALFGYQIYSVFLLSSLLRFGCHFLLSRKFREVRKEVRQVSSLDLFFSVTGIRPMFGRTREVRIFPPEMKPEK